MVSNSAKLDRRTKQHTQFGVSASNGSRDMTRTKSWRKKRKKKNNKANWMVSNSAQLDRRTKQHTEFGVSTSNGSRDMGRTKSRRKKKEKRRKKNEHRQNYKASPTGIANYLKIQDSQRNQLRKIVTMKNLMASVARYKGRAEGVESKVPFFFWRSPWNLFSSWVLALLKYLVLQEDVPKWSPLPLDRFWYLLLLDPFIYALVSGYPMMTWQGDCSRARINFWFCRSSSCDHVIWLENCMLHSALFWPRGGFFLNSNHVL